MIANILIKLHFRKHTYTILLVFLLVAITGLSMFGQNPRRDRRQRRARAEAVQDTTQPQLPDSLIHVRDSIRLADSTSRADSLDLLSKSSISKPAFSAARDSSRQVFADGQRKMFYWGDVEVSYENIKLKADYMEYDMNSGTVFARGTYDSLAHEWKGQPVMSQGEQTFNMEEIRYNFNTRKARITNMITREDDGILHGQNIKMLPDRSINITHGKYTVCDLEHPHYYLKLSSAKVITRPSQKTVFGPAHLVVEDVDLPFVTIPFGFIPKRPERATGLLKPSFGEENARGF